MKKYIIARALRKIRRSLGLNNHNFLDESRVEYKGQAANDYVLSRIENASEGLMISKFGTVELGAVCACKNYTEGIKIRDYIDFIRERKFLDPDQTLEALCLQAGFFPKSIDLELSFAELVLNDVKEIDILGSYIDKEKYLEKELNHCVKIGIDGYLAPFLWKNPWTKVLEGKKVLVVHPFTESIKEQYEKRLMLFEDKTVLPDFKELILVKAVQSIAGNGEKTGFSNWFEALEYMKGEIDKCDYDIALIGCGAYGMSLAAHCKRRGKIAVHMAGWLQMLFGIYGQRWVNDQPEYAKYINEYWITPKESERPANLEKVENGAYW